MAQTSHRSLPMHGATSAEGRSFDQPGMGRASRGRSGGPGGPAGSTEMAAAEARATAERRAEELAAERLRAAVAAEEVKVREAGRIVSVVVTIRGGRQWRWSALP